jgi:hypothetical protein
VEEEDLRADAIEARLALQATAAAAQDDVASRATAS